MNFSARSLGERRVLDVSAEPDAASGRARVRFRVDGGAPREAEAQVEGDRLRLWIDGRVFDLWLEPGKLDGPAFVTLGGERLRVDLVRGSGGALGTGEGARGGRQPISSPMPGRIVAVRVKAGDRVAKGDLLFTLEAMKMQNEFVAPFAGRIASLAAAPGRVASAGEVLAELEPETP